MGKYRGDSILLKAVKHPLLDKQMFVPEDYEFFKLAEEGKLQKAQKWLDVFKNWGKEKIVLEAFAGAGILTMIYIDNGYKPFAIEKKHGLSEALKKNIELYFRDFPKMRCLHADNMDILPNVSSDSRYIKIIDLDSYSHCVPQIKQSARILKDGLLFATSGEIYRICRFKNYSFIKERYGMTFDGSYKDFPEAVLYEFIKKEFANRGKKTELFDMFIWPTICRLCIKVY